MDGLSSDLTSLIDGYATVRPYWPDLIAYYLHHIIHYLGTASLLSIPLFFLRRIYEKDRKEQAEEGRSWSALGGGSPPSSEASRRSDPFD